MHRTVRSTAATLPRNLWDARRMIETSSYVLLLSIVALLGLGNANANDHEIPVSPEEVRPIAVGEMAPHFTVQTVAGDDFDFRPGALQRPVIIITFRGGWCPYCNMHLSELRHVMPEIRALGIDILFLSGDRPEILYESLKPETQADIADLDYTIYSDASADAATALGIAFQVDPAYRQRLADSKRDIAESSIERMGILPVPAVFAIGTDGVVAFSKAIPDYKVRVPADQILAVAKSLAGN